MSPLLAIVLSGPVAPDPTTPSIIAFGGAVGSFVAGSVARVRRLPPERVGRMTLDGTWIGAGCGVVGYLATYLL